MGKELADPLQSDRPENPLSRAAQQLIEVQVERTPNAVALTVGQERITYRELNSRSNRLAHFLCSLGAGPGRIVGVYLDRSFDSVVALLAILKCGAIYLPLDPKYPKDRLEFMIEDSAIALLVAHSSRQESLPATSARVLLLDRERESIAAASADNLDVCLGPEQVAYVIYTSGSTGKPKGVMIAQSALVNFLVAMRKTPGVRESDILLSVTPTSFDISLLEYLVPLTAGAQIVMATTEQAGDGRELQRLLEQFAVTLMQATPATWRMLLENNWEGKSDLRILCGGEALTLDLARQLLPRSRELWNMYGPTEATVWSSVDRVLSPDRISLGEPIPNLRYYVLDEHQKPVAAGTPGELWIGGTGIANGYLNRPELTAERFVVNPSADSENPAARLYRTGDEVRYRPDGSLEFLGRLDHQVKLHGFRIELGEIECVLAAIDGIAQAVVTVREDRPGDKRMVAYYTGRRIINASALIESLKTSLPDYMIPSAFVPLERFPLTPNSKVDRKALPAPENKRPLLAQDFIAPRTQVEKQLASLWCELLQLEEIGIDDSFFELGGNSLAAVRMVRQFHARFGREIPAVEVFQHPTIAKLAELLEGNKGAPDFLTEAEQRRQHPRTNEGTREPIAIIGMSGRFPGASNPGQLWRNLSQSVESISFFKPEELGPGIEDDLRTDPNYIRARGLIEGADLFDASFFGIGPLEARIMDPQQRVFLELAQEALENAGYDQERYNGRIGVFAGSGDNHYYTSNVITHPELLALAGKLAVEIGNEKDYISLRVAYLLDLRGPAVSVHAGCSTTLLAVDEACRSLLSGECSMALAGGIDIHTPQKSGFLHQEGGVFAKDGHCRPFDAAATGTMFCDGSGIVVLKRLTDALKDGDTIYSVIRGSGKNNNGSRPASFVAPSMEGQAEVIAIAQADAQVPIESIRYIEAHGTGTPVGDPIEFDALRKVFERKTDKKHFCYVGSIKGNIGHPTNAAGVVGLIKAALVLHHELIPPTLHFKTPNPRIDLANSPFMIADKLIPLPRGPEVRRAAVSSFGFGGTNVHVILEEAPLPGPAAPSRPRQLLLLSAKSEAALNDSSESLREYLATAPAESFADAACTLQTGRKQFAYRRFVVAGNPAEAAKLLAQPNPLRCGARRCERRNPPVVFLFGGQGTQYVNMGLNLYRDEPLFRAIVDDCCETLKPHLGHDLRELLFPPAGDEKAAQISLKNTLFTQPSIFVIEYALARFWQSLGVEPALMAGHSIGEFVAATLAGVWELEDVLAIVALRGKLMQSLPRGSMLAVNSNAESIANLLPQALQIASNNAPNLCVVSGPEPDVSQFQAELESKQIICRTLHTSHAFHSAMMDPIIEPLRAAIEKVKLRAPQKPFVSTVTGLPITVQEATDPGYWARHARATVEFAKSTQYLKDQGYDLFVECGPRSTMCSLVRQQFTPEQPCTAIPTFGDTAHNNAEWDALLFAMGSLWQNGVTLSWDAFYAHEERRRIPLPTYPFQRSRFWIDPAPVPSASQSRAEISRAIPWQPVGSIPSQLAASQSGESARAESAPVSRRERIASLLVDLLAALSGRERSQISRSSTFMEQGFDSLSLTQVGFTIRKEFPTKVSFSQLMNELPNVDMLADHLDQTLPPGILTESRSAQPVAEKTPLPVEPLGLKIEKTGNPLDEAVAVQAQVIARLVTLLEEAGVHLPVAMAAAAEAGSPVAPTQAQGVPPKRLANSSGVLEAQSTIPQVGIFASACLSRNLSASYNESMTVRFTGITSAEKMARAIDRLVERHDALRASFDETGRTMKINPKLKIDLPVLDFSKDTADGPAEQEERLRAVIAADTALPFNLPAGPLFRCQMILLASDRAAVILTAHHVICDGWSLDVMIHDLCAFYSEEISNAKASLGLPDSYIDYVQSVTRRQLSQEFKDAGDYWHKQFVEGFPILVLPTDHPRKARRDFSARRVDHPVPSNVVLGLRSMAAKHGCSFFTALIGSLSILFARISRQRQFVISLPTAEQPVSGQPGLVGQCVNLLPLAVELREGESISAFFKRLQGDLVQAQENSIYTLLSLLQDLRPSANLPGLSPISAGFTNVGRFRPGQLPQSGFTVDYDPNPKAFESFEFYLNAVELEDRVDLYCHFDVNLFEDLTIREWLSTLTNIYADVATDPARDVLSLAHLDCADSNTPAETFFARLKSRPDSSEFPLDAASSLKHSNGHTSLPFTGSPSPEPELLQSLLALWRHVLGVHHIGPDDDFFLMGGNSMAAATLFALIQKELGYAPSLGVLYDASTPRQLAQILAKGNSTEHWDSLVAINRLGDRTPLFLVHAAEGNVLLYRSLAAHLGADQPVWGLQSAGLDGKSPVDPRFEHVASLYIDEIRKIQPHGPYMLGGYCLGGTIAFEMAHQLIEAGEKVGLVAMIEDYNLRAMRWPLALHHHLINRFFLNPYFHLRNVLSADGRGKFDFFMDKLNVEIRRMTVSVRGSWSRIEDLFFPRRASAPPRAKLADVYDDAQVQYDIKPYPGELTLFFAEKHLAGFNAPLGGWGGVAAGGVRYYALPCSSRGSMIEPYVKHLARILRNCLDQALEQSITASGNECLARPRHQEAAEETHAGARG
jgi:amino acid adenylation domain-containing protein